MASRDEMRAAAEVLRKWHSPFEEGREPTAREILLAVAFNSYAGRSRGVADIYEGELTQPWLHNTRLSRPETWIPHEDGRGFTGNGKIVYPEALPHAIELLRRYKAFCRYMREERHSWTKVDEIHWADNSIDVVERSQLTGAERRRMVLAPGGDVCF